MSLRKNKGNYGVHCVPYLTDQCKRWKLEDPNIRTLKPQRNCDASHNVMQLIGDNTDKGWDSTSLS